MSFLILIKSANIHQLNRIRLNQLFKTIYINILVRTLC